MKPINITTIIRKYKGVFSSAVLSLIIHISMFLAIPTFSLIAIDNLEDSKGQFLTVEMIDVEGKASEIVENLKTRETGSLEEKKAEGKKAGKVEEKKTAPVPEVKLEAAVNSEADLKEDEKSDLRPLPEAVPPVEEDKGESPIDQIPGVKSEAPERSINDPSSMEREKGTGHDSSEMKDAQVVPAQMPNTEDVQPAEQEEQQGPGADEKEAATKPFVAYEKENVQTAAAEDIKDNQIVDVMESVMMEKEGPVAEPESPTPITEHPAPLAKAEKTEIKVEGRKRDMVPGEGLEDEEVGAVKEAEAGKGSPAPAGIVHPVLPVADYPQDLHVAEKTKESASNIEQKVEVEEKNIAKNEPMPVSDKKPDEMKVAEKGEVPANIIRQNAEPPAKKKKRVIPFHKMVEPENGTVIGIPLGRPVIKITAPTKKKVSSRVQSVSGRAEGKGVTRVTLSVNGENTTIPVQNGRFLWDMVLRDGKNTISGTVWDTDGKSASDTVMVEVLPPKNSFMLSIDEPGGDIGSPVAMVRGRVDDSSVDTVRLILNGEIFEIAVEDGYFEKMVLFKERENTLAAEATNSAGLTARTEPLKVMVRSPLVADILIHLVWSDTEVELHPGISRKERSNLDDERAAGKDVNMVEVMSAVEGYGEKIFSVREADGAYALKVSGGKGTDCKLVVSLNSSRGRVRAFEKRLMDGEEWIVGRFLMPEGVFWDEDEWFSGRIEGSNSMIKYNSPEGITWKELK